jgi:hypothetical protein
MVELLHRHAPFGTELDQTRSDGKALGTRCFARTRTGVDLNTLALDALPFCASVVRSLPGRTGDQQDCQQQLR